jgi:hypothetical protein
VTVQIFLAARVLEPVWLAEYFRPLGSSTARSTAPPTCTAGVRLAQVKVGTPGLGTEGAFGAAGAPLGAVVGTSALDGAQVDGADGAAGFCTSPFGRDGAAGAPALGTD